ncbi:hypothetical protein K2173_010517 [Erythroxylum novogranatense]|uniref:Uncharacterized protein n=1 Tax=Erythroxylum novogranatense TaxID=1862640 RepID=A0AAV8TDU7_9ROSI|nr:hypothetical protein K2173_010517 [Erythroxylum novogranatense]
MARLKGIQLFLSYRHSSYLVNLEVQLAEEYRTVLRQEELFWFQKSRIKWLQEGDRATAFFHATTLARRNKNWIDKLCLRTGEVLSYFQDLFCTTEPTPRDWNLGDHGVLPEEAYAALLKPVDPVLCLLFYKKKKEIGRKNISVTRHPLLCTNLGFFFHCFRFSSGASLGIFTLLVDLDF